jgi:hypothetical protein
MTEPRFHTPNILQVGFHYVEDATLKLTVSRNESELPQSIWISIGEWPTRLTLYFDSLAGVQEFTTELFNQAEVEIEKTSHALQEQQAAEVEGA